MERWSGKTAVVTGASAGIGAAICVALANAGMTVVGLARRPHLVDNLKSEVTGTGSVHSKQCDVSKLEDISVAFQWIEDTFGGVDVLVNNAGVFHQGQFTDLGDCELSDEQIISTIDTNLKGVVFCTRRALASMKKRNFDGHIVNINSIAGLYVPFSSLFNIYPASKHAACAFTASLLNELADYKNKIKVTSICPGLVDTAMASEAAKIFPTLRASDVADAVLYVVSTPPSVNINEISISPVSEKRL
ncbi:farnesol dehydrogenase-like [Plodia interpunctella]|uniref:farnesol dehydrogenase-like n=1 Tax=Plodia interpunctella TaxID=58824 RepID=UPI0023684169|nr:farnesol dehydrogenase-like [Plodia interpunctella]XP_053617120.1 farnesol dehydrogenase-like [Plodia interpunctella]